MFNYDKRFIPGHKCKGKLFIFSTEENTFWEIFDEEDMEEEGEIKILEIEDESKISFHALQRKIGMRTIMLEGFIKSRV